MCEYVYCVVVNQINEFSSCLSVPELLSPFSHTHFISLFFLCAILCFSLLPLSHFPHLLAVHRIQFDVVDTHRGA